MLGIWSLFMYPHRERETLTHTYTHAQMHAHLITSFVPTHLQTLLPETTVAFDDCVGDLGYHSFSALIDFGICLSSCDNINENSTLSDVQTYMTCV